MYNQKYNSPWNVKDYWFSLVTYYWIGVVALPKNWNILLYDDMMMGYCKNNIIILYPETENKPLYTAIVRGSSGWRDDDYISGNKL